MDVLQFYLAIEQPWHDGQKNRKLATSLKDPMTPNIHKLNRFITRVARIHMGHKELSGSSMKYRKADLVLIEQGISDTLCSFDPDLISWETIYQVEVFFRHLDLAPGSGHVIFSEDHRHQQACDDCKNNGTNGLGKAQLPSQDLGGHGDGQHIDVRTGA